MRRTPTALCSQRCEADRSGSLGRLPLGRRAFVYQMPSREEPWISPSYTVYVSCNLRCLFCSEWNRLHALPVMGCDSNPEGLLNGLPTALITERNPEFCGRRAGVNLLPVLETLSLLPGIGRSSGIGMGIHQSWLLGRSCSPGWWIGSSVTRNALERSRDSNPPPTKSSEPVLSSRERGRPCLSAIWSCRVTWSVAPFLLWNAGATSLARHRLT